jgi:hypothetical protein
MTILIVGVLAIEIEQKITQSGSMEFEDMVAGLSGFIVFFILFILIRVLLKEIKKR